MINSLDLFARVLISVLFLLNGVFKISNYEGSVDWMESFGLPGILIIPAIILEIIGPILIPQSSNTAAAPNIRIKILIALIIQLTKSLDSKPPTDLITAESGPII